MKARTEGFTLLEVMVAVAILALSLTAIFSSEAGAVKMAHRARKIGLASLLVRCKMGEIEEQVAAEGLPAVFDSGSDECCEDGEITGFSCDWEIEPVVLPDNMFASEEGEEGSEGGEKESPLSKMSSALGLPTDDKGGASMEGLDPSALLSGGGGGGLAAMALEFTYPILKPSFEQQIRRATVTIHWKEGATDHSFDVTQYLVSDQPIVDPAAAAAAAAAGLDPNAAPGTGTGTGTPAAPGAPILGGAVQ